MAAKRTQTYVCNLLLGLLDILVVAIEHVDGLRMGFPFQGNVKGRSSGRHPTTLKGVVGATLTYHSLYGRSQPVPTGLFPTWKENKVTPVFSGQYKGWQEGAYLFYLAPVYVICSVLNMRYLFIHTLMCFVLCSF